MIMAMHDVPYMATMSPAYIPDMVRKLEKAMAVDNGLVYLHVYNPCVTGWGCKSDESIEVARRSAGYVLLYQIPAWLLYTGLRKIFRDAGEDERAKTE